MPNNFPRENDRPADSRIKVCVVMPCTGQYGGLEAYTLALSEFLHTEPGFEVRVIFKEMSSFLLGDDLRQMLAETPVDVRFVKRASSALWKEISWADVVHGQNASPDMALFSRLLHKPVVLTVHFNFLMKASARKLLWKLTVGTSARRIYISEFVRRTWEGTVHKPGSMVIHSVSKLPQADLIPSIRRKGFAFVGRWIANKGVDILVKAYRDASFDKDRWPLRLMGTGPLRGMIDEEINRDQIKGIEILGFVSPARKIEVMRYAKWVVAPSNTLEDLGVVPWEARNVGVPCIVSRDGGLPESGGREALQCEPGSVDDLRLKLEKAAMMDEMEYAHRSERTRAELTQQLTPWSYYAGLYRELCATH